MSEKIDSLDFMYSTIEVAEKVGLAESTVRKYSQILEKNGYTFSKNSKGKRLFIKADINVFHELKNAENIEKTAKSISERQEKLDIDQLPASLGELIKANQKNEITAENLAKIDEQYGELKSIFTKLVIENENQKQKIENMELKNEEMNGKLDEILKKMNEEPEPEKKSIWKKFFG